MAIELVWIPKSVHSAMCIRNARIDHSDACYDLNVFAIDKDMGKTHVGCLPTCPFAIAYTATKGVETK